MVAPAPVSQGRALFAVAVNDRQQVSSSAVALTRLSAESEASLSTLIPQGWQNASFSAEIAGGSLAQLPPLPADDPASSDSVPGAAEPAAADEPQIEPAGAGESENLEADGLEDNHDNESSDVVPAEESVSPPTAEPTADPEATSPAPLDPSRLKITADTQAYDSERQVVTARGNVVFELNNAYLLADELWVNLTNRYVLAEGNVFLTSGEQEIRGERAEYSLTQEAGTLFDARGELLLTRVEDDFAAPLRRPVTSRSLFDPLNPDQPVEGVRTTGGFRLSSRVSGATPGSLPESGGGVQRIRFEAARVNFDAERWVGEEVRLTNDPFSPPELEFRSERMELAAISPTQDLLTTANPRLVFDQGFSLPLLRSRYVINRGEVDPNQASPFAISINSDSRDRGGVYVEREFSIIRNPQTNFSITPQYFVERAFDAGATDPSVLGLEADFRTVLNPRSDISASATVTGFDLDEIEDNVRGNIRARQLIGTHSLTTEYSYRDRLYNGSLGFQTVRSSLGAVLLSPNINLDGRGLNLVYQVGGQWVTADTDRRDLLDPPPRDNNRISLGRFQASARLTKRFSLWRGKPLPPTQTEGLRYTPAPIVPYLNLNLGLLGVSSYYTSGDSQQILAGDIRLDGQVGHLSDNWFDYTRFNLGYYQTLFSSDESPFLFDRNEDRQVLTLGAVQQIYGPLLLGFQTSINLDSGERINTNIIAEYSRRTYGLVIRYSPTQSTGSIGFRLSDFDWLGSGSPFDSDNIRDVESGIVEPR